METVGVLEEGSNSNNGSPKKKGIQVSDTKKPLSYYVNLAKKYMKEQNEIELSGLEMAITTVVKISEMLKTTGLAIEKKISTSTVDSKDESKGKMVKEVKIEILLGKTENFDTLLGTLASAEIHHGGDDGGEEGGEEEKEEKEKKEEEEEEKEKEKEEEAEDKEEIDSEEEEDRRYYAEVYYDEVDEYCRKCKWDKYRKVNVSMCDDCIRKMDQNADRAEQLQRRYDKHTEQLERLDEEYKEKRREISRKRKATARKQWEVSKKAKFLEYNVERRHPTASPPPENSSDEDDDA